MRNLLTEEVRNELLAAFRWFLEVTKVNFLFGVVSSLFLVPIFGLCILIVAITEPQIDPDSCAPVPFDGCE